MILTPDQRLRVFVSSTLHELAAEREAVRRAIESLELVPVMFELGARPHAPRTLYRAYLEQSHVFVGIYGQRYGWTAPDMDISGLEDEYALSGRLARLVYVRNAQDREPGLVRLLERIEEEASVSYKTFDDSADLEQLVRRDLVTLLSERFAEAGKPTAVSAPVPAPTATLIDRARELDALEALLSPGGTRLVTLTGPGGVGKTRLAIEAARGLADRFADGVSFVPLAAVEDERLVPAALAAALGVSPSGAETELDAVAAFFGDGRALLVIDNFEQLAAAAAIVTELLSQCRNLAVLVTSRAVLRLQGEHELVVDPLGVPTDAGAGQVGQVGQYDAVRLFIDRARAVRPSFHVDDDNAQAVAEICARLDGLPLAIELAAARVKLLTPEQLLDRLARRLDLASGRRDAPERHQTLRNTMQWSYELLDPAEKELFARLGVFAGRFTLEAAEAVAGDVDVVELLSSLIDKSLVRADPRGPAPGFSLLRTVREFALELLDTSDAAADARAAHAQYYLHRAREAHAGQRGPEQASWHQELAAETDNLHAAFEWWLAHRDLDTLADVGWSLWIFWVILGSYVREGDG
jgi:predicted ATPase